MRKEKKDELKDGVLTTPMNVRSREFREFQLFLSNKIESLGEKQKLQIELMALQIKIEDYLKSNEWSNDIVSVGDFLRLYLDKLDKLDKLDIKQNKLVSYHSSSVKSLI